MLQSRSAEAVGSLEMAVAEELAELVPRLYRLLRTALDEDERAPSLEQLRVMHRIDEGYQSVSSLAVVRQMRMSALTAVIDALEGRGWVSRHPEPSDRRRTRLELTSEGRGALRRGRRLTSRRMAEILEHDDGGARSGGGVGRSGGGGGKSGGGGARSGGGGARSGGGGGASLAWAIEVLFEAVTAFEARQAGRSSR